MLGCFMESVESRFKTDNLVTVGNMNDRTHLWEIWYNSSFSDRIEDGVDNERSDSKTEQKIWNTSQQYQKLNSHTHTLSLRISKLATRRSKTISVAKKCQSVWKTLSFSIFAKGMKQDRISWLSVGLLWIANSTMNATVPNSLAGVWHYLLEKLNVPCATIVSRCESNPGAVLYMFQSILAPASQPLQNRSLKY